MNQKSDYEQLVDAAVLQAIEQGAQSFAEICRAGQGAFPTQVLASLRNLESGSPLAGRLLRHDDLIDLASGHESWPEPSPFDYEWRFSPESARELARAGTALGGPILCLGTPTVFASLSAARVPAVLVDRNRFVTTMLAARTNNRVICADVADLTCSMLTERVSVAVMDPPWYRPHFSYWLQQVSHVLTLPASIITTVLPPLVRPGAPLEREAMLMELRNVGTVRPHLHVSYETPSFEQETLIANSVPPLAVWRMAEAFQTDIVTLPKNEAVVPPGEPAWQRYQIGAQAVGLRANSEPDAAAIHISPLHEDGSFFLSTVSARDPARERIDFWTSRNRCARVAGTPRVARFLSLLEHNTNPTEAINHVAASAEDRMNLQLLQALVGQ